MSPFAERNLRAAFVTVCVISAYINQGVNAERAAESYGSPCRTKSIPNGYCTTLHSCPGLTATTLIEGGASRAESGCRFLENKPMVCCPRGSGVASGGGDDDAAVEPINPLIPTLHDCGVGTDSPTTVTDIRDHPWLALLQYTLSSRKAFGCGGVLVSSRYVLTAAHCIQSPTISLNRSLTSIRLGDWDLYSDKDCQRMICADPSVDIPVESTVVHELYQHIMCGTQNDIGLVRMARPVTYSEWIKPICLPLSSQTVSQKSYIDEELEVAGWRTSHAGPMYDKKKRDYALVVPETRCSSIYSALNETLADTRICAVSRRASRLRDSGGPLLYRQKGPHNKWFVAGVSSVGPFHCRDIFNVPDVYTDVSKYSLWIAENIKP